MARTVECLCGCKRRLQGSDARISERWGLLVQRLIDDLEDYTRPSLQGEHSEVVVDARHNTESFIRDGHALEETLAAIVHREVAPGVLDRRHMKRWIRTASAVVQSSIEALEKEASQRQHQPEG